MAACAPIAPRPTLVSTETDLVRVYFTDPTSPGARHVNGGPDEELAAALDEARISIDVAIYDLDLWSIRDALLEANERGVQVRMVIESDYAGNDEIHQLAAAGIPVVVDTSPNFMHSKFVVIDDYEVWSGSTNYTVSDMYGNYNNLIAIRSVEVAENYETEFDEMFVQGLFGEASMANTPNQRVEFSSLMIENYFSPDDGVLDRLVDLIDGAQESIYFLAFSFTSDELARAIVAARRRGVDVAGVMDEGQITNDGGEFSFFRSNDVPVRIDTPGSNLHDKVLIIDGQIVVTGSYNFSANAEERNDENTLVIYSEELAQQYLTHFQSMWRLTKE